MHQKDFLEEEKIIEEEIGKEAQKDMANQQDENQEVESDPYEEIEVLKGRLEEADQRNLRLRADFENFKKRVFKEKEDIYRHASLGLVKNLLPVLDDFERALASIKENQNESQGYLQGIEMVYKQFIQVLSKEGVEEIPSLGETLDPNVHEAVAQEFNEEFEDHCIMEVFQKGYRLKGKVIRPSMVKVCIHS